MSYLQKFDQKNKQAYLKSKRFLEQSNVTIEPPPINQSKISKQQYQKAQDEAIKYQTTINPLEQQDEDQDIFLSDILCKYLKDGKGNQQQSNNSRNGGQHKNQSYESQNYSKKQAKRQNKVKVKKKIPKNISKQIVVSQNAKVGRNLTQKNDGEKKVTISNYINSNQPVVSNYIKASNREWDEYKSSQDYRLFYVLSKFPKIKQFKNNQKAIIKCGLQGHDIFVCMPTGGGKSLTFQVLSFLDKGVYLCILPLVSLIIDQQSQANMLGIEAYSLTASASAQQVNRITNQLQNFSSSKNSILLLVTPQKLNLSQRFIETIDMVYKRGQLKRVIIDEIHCVSTWGKQFRKEYQNLNSLKKRFPKTPILGLTATVTESVKQDIISQLGIDGCYYFQSSFNRPNLYYQVKKKDKNVMAEMRQIIDRNHKKSGIIYCLSKKDCEQVSSQLNRMGYKTSYYHSDIAQEQKKYIQEKWMRNEIQIITATIAFGMGINKPDVRFVIHQTMSKSLENYYQESGRAGRDGQYAECILFYRKYDVNTLQGMTNKNQFSSIESKEFSARQLANIIKYCEQKFLCRRKFQLQYLGETDFDEADCNMTCDNCKSGQHYIQVQFIAGAKLLVQLLIKIDKSNINLSKNQVISFIKGKQDKKIGYKLEQMERTGIVLEQIKEEFCTCKNEEIEMMLLEFMSFEMITEKIVENKFTRNNNTTTVLNAFLKCNMNKCNLFLKKVESFTIRKPIKNRTYYHEQTKSDNYSQDLMEIEDYAFGGQETAIGQYKQYENKVDEKIEFDNYKFEETNDQKYRCLLESLEEQQENETDLFIE